MHRPLQGYHLVHQFFIEEGEDADCAKQQLNRAIEDTKLSKKKTCIELWEEGTEEARGQFHLPFMPAEASCNVRSK